MTQFPDDDPMLTNFLRQHRAAPPLASPDLEDRIVHAIATDRPAKKPGAQVISIHKKRSLWLVPSTLAAGLMVALVSYQTLQRPQVRAGDTANLETFVENNWDNSLLEEPAAEWVVSLDSTGQTTHEPAAISN
ncbi:MAG: hypothetical protein KME16_10170 [Scytolyngbya sp. HA4215-MV1]|jgi:hypothetical protein|nr:hypothetical protein [Scytolyngbya sp. HA4215-MV1]